MKKLMFFLVLLGLVGLGGILYYSSVQSSIELVEITPVEPTVQRINIDEVRVETVLEGLRKPWDIVILPDETVLFTEDEGTISKLANGQKEVVVDVPNVNPTGEGGLMGLTVDAEFTEFPFVYACYATDADIRVSRWEWRDEELINQTDIITGMPVNRTTYDGRHSGCRPRFGPDNLLWVGTGDVAIGTTPQDAMSLGGKVLRVDRDGNAAPDNPRGELDARIYSYGHRNVQGLAFTESGEPFIGVSVEHGPRTDDEVNELTLGANFGWDPVPGYNESVPMTDTEKYPNAVAALWSSGSPTLAPSGATFVYGEEWGQYSGVLFIAMQKTQHVRLVSFDEDGQLSGEEEWLKDEYGRIRSVVQAPDGSVYITTDNGENDKILRAFPS